jgi:branched-chain amino acid transport system permease protein
VRITNLAILFVLLSLGLNIVVGFAGLLDLGYIAFYAVGRVHVRAARLAALRPAPAVLDHPAARRRGRVLLRRAAGRADAQAPRRLLAIVTLGFGEIIRIFLNNLSQPVNLTNGPQGSR